MSADTHRKRCFLWILLLCAAMILLTRMVTLTYNRQLHPDEHVFYLTVNSLSDSILNPGVEFQENKEYPEGTYLFQLPFQLAGQILRNLAGIEGTKGLQHLGRIASVFYYLVAVALGFRLLWKYLARGLVSLVVYGLTSVFSLFLLEQSRYGTGDIISLMLVMLLINLTAQALEAAAKPGWWVAAFFVSGVLGAVKYPQLVFLLIPLAACLSRKELRKARYFGACLLAVIAGFFLFSPKAMLDPAYVLRVIQRESGAYSFSTHEAGGLANHLLTLTLYLLLYSDFPLLPVLTLIGFAAGLFRFFKARKTGTAPEGVSLLLQVIVPGVCLFFFTYNLFVSVMFFRTLTIFFGVLALYTAVTAEALFSRGRWGRLVVVALAACMVLRGGYFVWVLSDDGSIQEKLSAMVSEAVDENWRETWYTCLFAFPLPETEGITTYSDHFMNPLVDHNGTMEIQPGQLIITGAQEFYLGQRYLLPVNRLVQKPIQLWADFKEANQDYLLGQLYPDYYYYLFGGWLRGGTLSQYELPCHYIYYRSQ